MLDIVVHLITAGVVNLMVSPASQVCKKGGQKSMRLLCCKPSSNVIMVGSKKNSAVGHSFVCIISVSIIFPYPLAEGLLILLFCFCTVCVQMLPFSSSPKWNVDNKNIINCSPGLISAKWVEPFGDPPSHVQTEVCIKKITWLIM